MKSNYAASIDEHHIGAAGLSLGGGTTYALTYNPCCIDPRVTAAAVFDGLQFGFGQPFGTNTVPVLIMHADTDFVLPYKTAQDAYRTSSSPKFFTTLFGGIHAEMTEDTPSVHDETTFRVSIDFWDLTLLGDQRARQRLLADGNKPKESHTIAG